LAGKAYNPPVIKIQTTPIFCRVGSVRFHRITVGSNRIVKSVAEFIAPLKI
jgi:hypothetical protein